MKSFTSSYLHIQQRDSIRQFSDQLVRGSILNRKLKTNKIRKDFIQFVTQVKLSHISDHNVVTRFYNRWRTIFDSDSIYDEVSEKLAAIDGFQQTKVSVLSFQYLVLYSFSSYRYIITIFDGYF